MFVDKWMIARRGSERIQIESDTVKPLYYEPQKYFDGVYSSL